MHYYRYVFSKAIVIFIIIIIGLQRLLTRAKMFKKLAEILRFFLIRDKQLNIRWYVKMNISDIETMPKKG